MRRPAARNLIVFCLLTLVSLLAASCSSGSDSSSAEDTTTTSTEVTTPSDTTTTSAETAIPQHKNALISITAGGEHSCTLREDGTISCWGNNTAGQLGNGQSGENADSSVPVEVKGIENTTAITAGSLHSCALSENGTISCWGDNTYGQLGNGQSGDDRDDRSADSAVPVEVAGITDATAITAGGNWNHSHSCALHQDGTISCWGDNSYGQLGNGQSGYTLESSDPIYEDGDISYFPRQIESSLPVKVEGITNAKAIATGYTHSCALHQDGTISCWGSNKYGQLGNGQSADDWYDRSADSAVPVEVAGITDATAISAGYEHSCALHLTGTISCWGSNGGQLGSKQIAESSVPVGVIDITDATAITTGFRHSCALRKDGTISCWGDNYEGQLGNGQSGPNTYSPDSPEPVKVAGITDATAITAGGNWNNGHSCTLHLDGAISCWGDNTHGQLGNGSKDNFSEPAKVVDITDATAINAGYHHSCALHLGGTISCWGDNYSGQLGNGQSGPNTDSALPVEVEGITEAIAISAGSSHSCALHQDGSISCWGSDGQLGNGSEVDSAVDSAIPVRVADITDATAITAGYTHSCALHEDSTISCWGSNIHGELGNGQSGYGFDSDWPVRVAGITDAIAITTGIGYSCALHQTGTISCWGNNEYGQLGNGTDGDSSVPVQVADITDATAITTGYSRSCALHEDGTISCWGYNSSVQTDDGQIKWSLPPFEVAGITDAIAITTGIGYSCALHQTGTISCWGNNEYSQLGNGQSGYGFDSDWPVRVAGIADATAITAGSSHSCALNQDGTISCWGSHQYGQLGGGPRLPQLVVGFGG